MNILHLTPYYPPAWAFGPTPGTVAALARAQAAHGHRVTVLTTDAMAPHERVHMGDSAMDGVRVVRVRNISGSTRTWLGCSTPVGMRRAASRLAASGLDVVHLHELVTVEALRAVPVIDARVPVVVSLHGQLREPGRLSGAVTRLWRLLGGGTLCTRLDVVVAGSDEEASHARRMAASLCARLADTIVIPDGLDIEVSGPAEAEPPHTFSKDADSEGMWGAGPEGMWGAGFSRHQPRRSSSDEVLLVDGRTSQPGALRAIVEAFAAARRAGSSARLVVTGPESPALSEAREAAQAHDVDACVAFVGYAPHSRMQQWLDGATALLVPAGNQTPESLAIDALARGVVVLTAGTSVSVDSSAVLRVSDAETGWADALTWVLDGSGSRARRAAAIASVAHLGWPAVAERWLTLYERLSRERQTGTNLS